ncbi:hypothetical protein K7X08_005878 [Anisodus acutangulus]|uniref:Uncharacterized protein n=1 Tax=Anisodus acutangulus TaxID=402998 RepID=A0A9Q1LRU2_9SOLA|nr:hypothetical protein K7X08_005878 [Anisodus acutangulus]
MGFLIQVEFSWLLPASDFSEGPDDSQASARCPEKGERTQKSGKTTALLLAISPFLEVIISFMSRSQMKLGLLLLVVSDRASFLEQDDLQLRADLFLSWLVWLIGEEM